MNINKVNIIFCNILGFSFLALSVEDYFVGNRQGLNLLIFVLCLLTSYILKAIDGIND